MSSPSSSASIDFTTQLKAIPLRNEKAETIDSGDDFLVLGVKLKYTGAMFFLSKALSLRGMKKYRLDGLSLSLYREIDDARNVDDLIDLMMERHKLSFFEARGLVAQFLDMLMRRGLVAVAVTKDAEK